MAGVLLESRSFRPFKTSEEYLYAMKEDLAEWLNTLYPELDVNVDNFMDKLETGVVLCKHANNVRKQANEYLARKQLRKTMSSAALTQSILSRTAVPIVEMGDCSFKPSAKPGTFFARDNVSNFIDFARKGLEILECLLFETEDLIMRKNEKNVILCLLEVARRGAKYGMLAPILVQMEREIDRELAADRGEAAEDSSDDEEDLPKINMNTGPIPQIVTNDLKSLDEMVRDLLEMCNCPTQFPMIRVSEGKYRIGDTKVLIFVRILRNHVMVRVGGGWDTLAHYLDKHDPCRCRVGHRTALSSKLIQKNPQPYELNNAFVHYERSPPRTRRSSASSSSSGHGGRDGTQDARDLLPESPQAVRNRSRSPTPRRDAKSNLQPPKYVSTYHFNTTRHRSASPSPSLMARRSRSPVTPQRRPSNELVVKSARTRSRSPASPSLRPNNDTRGRKRSPIPASLRPNTDTRGRSRSPGQLTVQSHGSYDSPTASSRNRSRSPSARVVRESAPVKCRAETVDGHNGDSGSEVSDEGYRSLGLIVTTPILGESKVVSQCDGHRHSVSNDSQITESPTSEASMPSNDDDDNQMNGLEDDKSTLKDDSISGSCSEMFDSRRTSREASVDSNVRSSPERSRRSSLMDETTASRRRSSMTRSRSASSGENPDFNLPARRISGEKCGTWNGKAKGKRGPVGSETFQRGSPGRSSLGAGKTEYDPHTGRRVQKSVSPLVSDLLQVKDLEDDKLVLQKMKELISQYSGLLESHDDNYGSGDEDRNAHRRKDSKYEGAISKIPAPVFYKQPSCEKEC